MSTATNRQPGTGDPQKVTVTPGPELNSALDDAVVQLSQVKENVDQAATEFAQLRQGIPNYNEVVAEIRQQQAQINKACEDASNSAQAIVSEVEQAAAKLSVSIDEEINMIKSVIGTGDEAASAPGPQVPPVPTPPKLDAGQGIGQPGVPPAGGPAQFPMSGQSVMGGGANQEMVAVQVAEALREFLRKEIASELSRQMAPLNEKLTEVLIGYMQQRSRDR